MIYNIFLFINFIILVSSLVLIWICYKRKNYKFIYIIIIAISLFKQLTEKLPVYNIIILSIIFAVILFAIIKIYSNKINNEHNKKILKIKEIDYQHFSINKRIK